MSNLFRFAENILNNLDQTTQSSIQSALNTKNGSPSSSSSFSSNGRHLKSKSHINNRSSTNSGAGTARDNHNGNDNDNEDDDSRATSSLINSYSSASLKSTQAVAGSAAAFKSFSSNNSSVNLSTSNSSWHPKTTASNNKSNKDDELMDFLNSSDFPQLSPEPALNLNSKASLEINTSNLDASPQPATFGSDVSPGGTSSVAIARAAATAGATGTSSAAEGGLVQFSIGSGGSDGKSKQSETEEDEEAGSLSGDVADAAAERKEKALLKAEIKSLSKEIQSLMKRINLVEEENSRSKRKIEQYQVQIGQSDKIIRELRAREDDMNESLRSKDSQLAVLRVRFDELDGELKQRQAELANIRVESERLLKDHSNSSDLQSQLVDTLKDKVNELEASLTREKEAYAHAQKENMNFQSRMEAEKQALAESLNSIEKRLNEEKNKNSELNSAMKSSKTTYNFLKQEFEEYKSKASKTLTAKDRLIATLKENASGSSTADSNGDETTTTTTTTTGVSLKSIEIDELKIERDALKEELNSKNVALDRLREEMMELESQSSIEIELLKDQMRELQDNIDESKQSKEYLEQDLKSARQQLEYAQEELYKQKTAVNTRLQEKDVEIEKLRSQLTTKSLGSTSEKELENRLHLLTENLIQKQTLIEALQSEKHSIFLQLERTEKRLQDYETILASKKNSSTLIRMHDEDDASHKQSTYFRESPYDHGVTRKVKRAASEIDKFGIRLGVFLKKYPIARIFVILYMFLLHLWVGIVLFTYKPEVHEISFDRPPGAAAHAPNVVK